MSRPRFFDSVSWRRDRGIKAVHAALVALDDHDPTLAVGWLLLAVVHLRYLSDDSRLTELVAKIDRRATSRKKATSGKST